MKTSPKKEMSQPQEEPLQAEAKKEESQPQEEPLQAESLLPLIEPKVLAEAIKVLAGLAVSLPSTADSRGPYDLSICYDIKIVAGRLAPMQLQNNITMQQILHPGSVGEAVHNFEAQLDLMMRPLKNYFIQLLQAGVSERSDSLQALPDYRRDD